MTSHENFAGDMGPLELANLLAAMRQCAAFYHQADRGQFYAMVAEEFAQLQPEREELSVELLARLEEQLKSFAMLIATAARSGSKLNSNSLPPTVRPLQEALLAFYESVGVKLVGAEHQQKATSPLSPTGSHNSIPSKGDDVGHTDGSSSDAAATPTIEDRGDGPLASPRARTQAVVPSTTATATPTGPVTDNHVHAMLRVLMDEQLRARAFMNHQEERVRAERQHLARVRDEYKTLKARVHEAEDQAYERQRLREVLQGRRLIDGSADDDGRGLKKECKKLKQLRGELQLKYRLMETEHKCMEMRVEKELADLRREYSDSYLFPAMTMP